MPAEEPSKRIKDILGDAAFLRGSIITSFAQVEFILSDLAVKCAKFPEYEKEIKKFPYKLVDRIKTVQGIMAAPGPLAEYKEVVDPLVTKLLDYEELRHYLAHGILILRPSPTTHTLEYRMYRPSKRGLEIGFLETNTDQLTLAAEEIANYSQSVISVFREFYLKHNLDHSTDTLQTPRTE